MVDKRPPDRDWAQVAVCPPGEQVRWLTEHWRANGTYRDSTVARIADLAGRYAGRLTATGIGSLTEATDADMAGFVAAPTRRGQPPAVATVHLRRVTLRAIYRTIAQCGGPEVVGAVLLELPPRAFGETRPLRDDELTLVRIAATLHRARQLSAPVVVALGEATATTGETAAVRWNDIDWDRRWVALPGAGPVAARTGQLTDWGAETLAVHHCAGSTGTGALADPARPVVLRHDADDRPVSQAAVVMLIGRLLRAAGVDSQALRPGSLRLWAPAQMMAAGGRVELAARALGLASLDTCARLLAWGWNDR